MYMVYQTDKATNDAVAYESGDSGKGLSRRGTRKDAPYGWPGTAV